MSVCITSNALHWDNGWTKQNSQDTAFSDLIYQYLNIYIYIFIYIYLYMYNLIPLKIHTEGSGPPFCSYKTRGLRKSLQNDWVPRIFCRYNMVGPCASTTSFQHPSSLYGGMLSPDVRSCLFLECDFFLHAWTLCPKKGTILKEPVSLPFAIVFLKCH